MICYLDFLSKSYVPLIANIFVFLFILMYFLQTHTKTRKITKDGEPLDPIIEFPKTVENDIIVSQWTKVHYFGIGNVVLIPHFLFYT